VTSRRVPARVLMAPPVVWLPAYRLLHVALDVATVVVLEAPARDLGTAVSPAGGVSLWVSSSGEGVL
jgi:hypothetical protein